MSGAPLPGLRHKDGRDENMTDVLTVGALGNVLLSRWKMLVAFVVLGVVAGIAYGMTAPSTYTAKAVLFVIATPAEKDGYYQAAQFAEKRAATYPALLTAPEVLDRTRSSLGLDMPASALIPMLTATNPTDSSLVEVAATAGTPELASQLAGTAAQNLADYAVDLEASGRLGQRSDDQAGRPRPRAPVRLVAVAAHARGARRAGRRRPGRHDGPRHQRPAPAAARVGPRGSCHVDRCDRAARWPRARWPARFAGRCPADRARKRAPSPTARRMLATRASPPSA